MKFGATVGLALLLLVIESVAVKYLGFAITRIDVTVALVVFLSLRAGLLEGAFASFAIGYLLDVMSGRPTGLFVFLAVLVYLLGRLVSSLLDARSAPSFVLFVAGAEVAHSLLALFFGWMTSKSGTAPASVGALFAQLGLTLLAALLLWPLLRRLDPGTERPEAGALL
ncbi:MAG: hypothetical protein HYZ28_21790 [Myxococcales bacterium]|nr:hypothetical protein [Myxococcales bacterium]